MTTQPDCGAALRALHRKGDPFILANAWDLGSAQMLAALGAEALGTSSAGFAFTQGLGDAQTTREASIAHAEALALATPLPLSADLENGYGPDPEDAALTVRLAGEAGLAGCSIEDIDLPSPDAYAFDLAVSRVEAAVAAARALDRDFVFCARADGVMTGAYSVDEALRRLLAFEAAGADCVYAPILPDLATIARFAKTLTVPLNVLVTGPMVGHTRAEFAEAGVARLSLGSTLARLTHRAIQDAGEAMFGQGVFTPLQNAASGSAIDALLDAGRRPHHA